MLIPYPAPSIVIKRLANIFDLSHEQATDAYCELGHYLATETTKDPTPAWKHIYNWQPVYEYEQQMYAWLANCPEFLAAAKASHQQRHDNLMLCASCRYHGNEPELRCAVNTQGPDKGKCREWEAND